MEGSETSPPRPKPRVRRSVNASQEHTPSYPSQGTHPQTTPSHLSKATPSQPLQIIHSRPGVLAETREPFNAENNIDMLRWLFGQKLSGNEQVGEITVSHDRTRATVEFSHLERM